MNVRTRLTSALLVASVGLVVSAGALIAARVFADKEAIRGHLVERLTEWTGGKVTIAGPVRVYPFPTFRLEFDRLAIASPDLPHVMEIEAGTVRLELATGSLLRGSPKLNRIELDALRIVASERVDAPDATTSSAPPPLVRLLREAPAPEIAIDDGLLTVAGRPTGQAIAGIAAEFGFSRSGAASGEGSFLWRDRAVPFSYAMQAPSVVRNAVHVPIRVAIANDAISVRLRGAAAVGSGMQLGGSADIAIPDVRAFGDWIGYPLAAGSGLRDLRASGGLDWTGQRISFDQGAFALDGNSATGSLTVGYGSARPVISGTLALETLNLAPYLGGRAAADGDGAFDIALARDIDLDLRLSTARLNARPLSMGQTALTLGVENGAVAADLAILSVCGGKADMRLEAELARSPPRWRLSGAASGIAVKPCVDIFAPPSLIDGTGDIAVDLRGAGRTFDDLLAAVEGGLTFAVTDGQADIDFLKIVGKGRRGELKGWDAVRGNPTRFDRLEAQCSARAGRTLCSGLQAEAGSTRITGDGAFDLASRSLDWRLHLDGGLADGRPRVQQLVTRLMDAVLVTGSWFEPNFDVAGRNSGSLTPDPRTIDHASAVDVR